jgi:hypothetical protein
MLLHPSQFIRVFEINLLEALQLNIVSLNKPDVSGCGGDGGGGADDVVVVVVVVRERLQKVVVTCLFDQSRFV